jgi:MoxR-like ATPase
MLPTAHLAFLDEFFRASDAIADCLLHILGPERQARIDGKLTRLPIMSVIGASNTYADTAAQAAILDRWLIRRTVQPLSPHGRRRLIRETLPPVPVCLTLDDLRGAAAQAKATPASEAAIATMDAIGDELHQSGVCPSGRRFRAAMHVARASAVLDGAAEVQPHHLECLVDVLWDLPEHAQKAGEIVRRHANPVGARLAALLRETDDAVVASKDASTRMAGVKKLEETEREAEKLASVGNGRAAKALAYIRRERVRLQAVALGIDPAKAEALLGGKS